jgi:transketolase
MEVNNTKIKNLENLGSKIRMTALEMIYHAGSGHPGPCMSVADILAVLYFSRMRIRPQEPDWPERDRLILSKGHSVPSAYAALAEAGYFPRETLKSFRQVDSILQGHPDMKLTPGIDMTSGALGNGLSVGIGMALATKYNGLDYHVYVVLGDGECQEGQVWEAAIAAVTRKAGRLTAIVDRNGLCQTCSTENSAQLEPFAEKWRSFGWRVKEIDGHSIPELLGALDWAREEEDLPSVIIAKTVKGKGVSFMEDKPEWHAAALSQQQIEQARSELGFKEGEWLK